MIVCGGVTRDLAPGIETVLVAGEFTSEADRGPDWDEASIDLYPVIRDAFVCAVKPRLSSSTGVGEIVPPSTGALWGSAATEGGAQDGCRAWTGRAARSFGTH